MNMWTLLFGVVWGLGSTVAEVINQKCPNVITYVTIERAVVLNLQPVYISFFQSTNTVFKLGGTEISITNAPTTFVTEITLTNTSVSTYSSTSYSTLDPDGTLLLTISGSGPSPYSRAESGNAPEATAGVKPYNATAILQSDTSPHESVNSVDKDQSQSSREIGQNISSTSTVSRIESTVMTSPDSHLGESTGYDGDSPETDQIPYGTELSSIQPLPNRTSLGFGNNSYVTATSFVLSGSTTATITQEPVQKSQQGQPNQNSQSGDDESQGDQQDPDIEETQGLNDIPNYEGSQGTESDSETQPGNVGPQQPNTSGGALQNNQSGPGNQGSLDNPNTEGNRDDPNSQNNQDAQPNQQSQDGQSDYGATKDQDNENDQSGQNNKGYGTDQDQNDSANDGDQSGEEVPGNSNGEDEQNLQDLPTTKDGDPSNENANGDDQVYQDGQGSQDDQTDQNSQGSTDDRNSQDNPDKNEGQSDQGDGSIQDSKDVPVGPGNQNGQNSATDQDNRNDINEQGNQGLPTNEDGQNHQEDPEDQGNQSSEDYGNEPDNGDNEGSPDDQNNRDTPANEGQESEDEKETSDYSDPSTGDSGQSNYGVPAAASSGTQSTQGSSPAQSDSLDDDEEVDGNGVPSIPSQVTPSVQSDISGISTGFQSTDTSDTNYGSSKIPVTGPGTAQQNTMMLTPTITSETIKPTASVEIEILTEPSSSVIASQKTSGDFIIDPEGSSVTTGNADGSTPGPASSEGTTTQLILDVNYDTTRSNIESATPSSQPISSSGPISQPVPNSSASEGSSGIASSVTTTRTSGPSITFPEIPTRIVEISTLSSSFNNVGPSITNSMTLFPEDISADTSDGLTTRSAYETSLPEGSPSALATSTGSDKSDSPISLFSSSTTIVEASSLLSSGNDAASPVTTAQSATIIDESLPFTESSGKTSSDTFSDISSATYSSTTLSIQTRQTGTEASSASLPSKGPDSSSTIINTPEPIETGSEIIEEEFAMSTTSGSSADLTEISSGTLTSTSSISIGTDTASFGSSSMGPPTSTGGIDVSSTSFGISSFSFGPTTSSLESNVSSGSTNVLPFSWHHTTITSFGTEDSFVTLQVTLGSTRTVIHYIVSNLRSTLEISATTSHALVTTSPSVIIENTGPKATTSSNSAPQSELTLTDSDQSASASSAIVNTIIETEVISFSVPTNREEFFDTTSVVISTTSLPASVSVEKDSSSSTPIEEFSTIPISGSLVVETVSPEPTPGSPLTSTSNGGTFGSNPESFSSPQTFSTEVFTSEPSGESSSSIGATSLIIGSDEDTTTSTGISTTTTSSFSNLETTTGAKVPIDENIESLTLDISATAGVASSEVVISPSLTNDESSLDTSLSSPGAESTGLSQTESISLIDITASPADSATGNEESSTGELPSSNAEVTLGPSETAASSSEGEQLSLTEESLPSSSAGSEVAISSNSETTSPAQGPSETEQTFSDDATKTSQVSGTITEPPSTGILATASVIIEASGYLTITRGYFNLREVRTFTIAPTGTKIGTVIIATPIPTGEPVGDDESNGVITTMADAGEVTQTSTITLTIRPEGSGLPVVIIIETPRAVSYSTETGGLSFEPPGVNESSFATNLDSTELPLSSTEIDEATETILVTREESSSDLGDSVLETIISSESMTISNSPSSTSDGEEVEPTPSEPETLRTSVFPPESSEVEFVSTMQGTLPIETETVEGEPSMSSIASVSDSITYDSTRFVEQTSISGGDSLEETDSFTLSGSDTRLVSESTITQDGSSSTALTTPSGSETSSSPDIPMSTTTGSFDGEVTGIEVPGSISSSILDSSTSTLSSSDFLSASLEVDIGGEGERSSTNLITGPDPKASAPLTTTINTLGGFSGFTTIVRSGVSSPTEISYSPSFEEPNTRIESTTLDAENIGTGTTTRLIPSDSEAFLTESFPQSTSSGEHSSSTQLTASSEIEIPEETSSGTLGGLETLIVDPSSSTFPDSDLESATDLGPSSTTITSEDGNTESPTWSLTLSVTSATDEEEIPSNVLISPGSISSSIDGSTAQLDETEFTTISNSSSTIESPTAAPTNSNPVFSTKTESLTLEDLEGGSSSTTLLDFQTSEPLATITPSLIEPDSSTVSLDISSIFNSNSVAGEVTSFGTTSQASNVIELDSESTGFTTYEDDSSAVGSSESTLIETNPEPASFTTLSTATSSTVVDNEEPGTSEPSQPEQSSPTSSIEIPSSSSELGTGLSDTTSSEESVSEPTISSSTQSFLTTIDLDIDFASTPSISSEHTGSSTGSLEPPSSSTNMAPTETLSELPSSSASLPLSSEILSTLLSITLSVSLTDGLEEIPTVTSTPSSANIAASSSEVSTPLESISIEDITQSLSSIADPGSISQSTSSIDLPSGPISEPSPSESVSPTSVISSSITLSSAPTASSSILDIDIETISTESAIEPTSLEGSATDLPSPSTSSTLSDSVSISPSKNSLESSSELPTIVSTTSSSTVSDVSSTLSNSSSSLDIDSEFMSTSLQSSTSPTPSSNNPDSSTTSSSNVETSSSSPATGNIASEDSSTSSSSSSSSDISPTSSSLISSTLMITSSSTSSIESSIISSIISSATSSVSSTLSIIPATSLSTSDTFTTSILTSTSTSSSVFDSTTPSSAESTNPSSTSSIQSSSTPDTSSNSGFTTFIIATSSTSSATSSTTSTISTTSTSSTSTTLLTTTSSSSSSSSSSSCVASTAAATAAPYCNPSLPAACSVLGNTNGLGLTSLIASCQTALGSYNVGPVATCLTRAITVITKGSDITACLTKELTGKCLTALPATCLNLQAYSGLGLNAQVGLCTAALGPFNIAGAATCLATNAISAVTTGVSVVNCLNRAYGFPTDFGVNPALASNACPIAGGTFHPQVCSSLLRPCADLSSTNGLGLLVAIPLCTASLGTYAVGDVLTCLSTDLVSITTTGSSIVGCLNRVLPPSCITSLPPTCLSLADNTNAQFLVNRALCSVALGLFGVGSASECLANNAATGNVALECLNKAIFTS